jgi:hypothetical protein
MRSVFLFLRGTDVTAVAGLLGGLCSTRQSPPAWVLERDGNACLYVRVHSGGLPEHDAEPESRSAIRSALGAEPDVTVTVDVSGRHGGDAEVRSFISALLGTFPGVAMDDFTDHCWTLDELLSGRSVEDHPLFD